MRTMSKAPAFQFYAGDRAMDIMGLDNEAVGAWTRAMMYLWTNGPTPSERLQQVAGNGWERVAFLFSTFEAGLGLVWQEELREKQRVFREKASSFGTKGGRPSKEEKGTLSQNKGYLKGTQRVRSMKKEDEVEVKGNERAGERPAQDPVQILEVIPTGVSVTLWEAIKRWEHYRVEARAKLTTTGKQAMIKKCIEMGEQRAIAAIDHSMANGWKGLFEPQQQRTNGTAGQSIADKASGALEILRSGGF